MSMSRSKYKRVQIRSIKAEHKRVIQRIVCYCRDEIRFIRNSPIECPLSLVKQLIRSSLEIVLVTGVFLLLWTSKENQNRSCSNLRSVKLGTCNGFHDDLRHAVVALSDKILKLDVPDLIEGNGAYPWGETRRLGFVVVHRGKGVKK